MEFSQKDIEKAAIESNKMQRTTAKLASFISYCNAHPHERFWQALRNWSGYQFLYGSNMPYEEGKDGQNGLEDTFYKED